MLGFVIQRVLQAALVMAAMSALVFVGVYAVGNPIDVLISPDATQDIRAATIARYGLDRPLYEQYFTFLGNILSGDMGRSFVFGMPVLQLIMQRLPATLELTLVAVIAATLAGVPLGIYAGYRPDSPAREGHHGGVDPRLLGADLLGRADPDPVLRRPSRLAAGREPRRRQGASSASSGASSPSTAGSI